MVDRPDERLGVYGSSLVDTSGYHFVANGHFKTNGKPKCKRGADAMVTRTVREAMVTRSVSEEGPDSWPSG